MVSGPELRRFMRRWPTGVAVVTTSAADRPAGCTVNSFTSVSLSPPLLLVCMSDTSRTLSAILRQGLFCVNLLGRRQRRLAELFAGTSPDQFRDLPFRLVHGMPVLDGVIAATVCEVQSYLPAADHVLLLGTPRWCTPPDNDEQPMVFFAGQYLTTGLRAEAVPLPAHR